MLVFFQQIIVVLIAVVAVVNPSSALLALLSGFILQDRAFAHWNIPTTWAPLYVTELALVGFAIHCVWQWKKTKDQFALNRLPFAWAIFLLATAESFVRGLVSHYAFPEILRDSALCYYATFTLWTWYVADRKWRDIAVRVLGFMVCLRAFGFLYSNFGTSLFPGQEGAKALYFSIALLFIVSAYEGASLKTKPLALCSLIMAAIFLLQVRSAWLSLTIVAFVSALAGFWHISWLQVSKRILISMAAGLIAAFGLLILPGSAMIPAELSQEIGTLALGKRSPNVVTRLKLWSDAIQQIFIFGEAKEAKKVFILSIPNTGVGDTGIGRYYGVAATDTQKSNDSTLSAQNAEIAAELAKEDVRKKVSALKGGKIFIGVPPLHANRWVRAFFGIPFGFPFLPAFGEYWLTTQRFDPHNSLLAIFYRTGFLGLLGAGAILFMLARRVFHYSKSSPARTSGVNPEVMATTLGILYCLGHSLTDVTLENPFKGVFIWVLLGFAYRALNDSET